ncbi:MAG: glycosyltransferase family 9 protein [Deltaproteobacteria bacterium]|nr:glycosyltransferase family 9 protein [Deltaproteobacteria bacterium]
MKIHTQRATDRLVGAFLCGILSLFPWRTRQVPSGFRPRKILVILLSEMGSLALARPMFGRIREKYPEASVHILVFRRNLGFLEVLDLVPKNRRITVDDRSFSAFFLSSLHALRGLRRIGIDTVLDGELFSRISSLYSLLSGAKVRAGFHAHTQEGLYRGGFINRPVLYNPYCHISEQFVHLIESIDRQGKPLVKETMPSRAAPVDLLKVAPEEIDAFSQVFQKDFPHLRDRRLVLVCPGGGMLPIRAWPRKYYEEVVNALLESGYAVGVIGLERDKALAGAILSACRNEFCLDLTGYTKTVKDLILLFHLASLLISNDGGPGHFASMTPIPAIVIYGPETPTLYGVLGPKSRVLYNPVSCSPCLTAYNHRRSPCDGNNVCLKGISPRDVLEEVYEFLRK